MNSLLWPWHGLQRFVKTPRWWFNALLGSAGGLIGVGVIATVLVWWYWPAADGDQQPGLGAWFGVASKVISALVGFLALVLPFTKGGAGRALLRPVLRTQGIDIDKRAGKRSFTAQLRYLLMTAGWRVFWVVAVVAAAWYHRYLGMVVGLWALGHLMCTDACDQALMLRGREFAERRWALAKRSPLLLAAGALAGALAGLLGITVFGWLLWAPGVFIGAALWVAEWDQPPGPEDRSDADAETGAESITEQGTTDA